GNSGFRTAHEPPICDISRSAIPHPNPLPSRERGQEPRTTHIYGRGHSCPTYFHHGTVSKIFKSTVRWATSSSNRAKAVPSFCTAWLPSRESLRSSSGP